MKPIGECTALVIDNGLFLNIAHRLAKPGGFGRVLYHTHWENGFPTINKGLIGSGYPDIERCSDIFSVINDVDVWVFPDIYRSGMQLYLESIGKNVWGSRSADSFEFKRQKFHKLLGKLGLDVPQYVVIHGMNALREHLKHEEDKYLKISTWRGSMETTHWRSWAVDEGLLDLLAVRFGPAKELIPFIVFDAIETDLEIGADTYCIDGQFPDLMFHGVEAKDKGYMGMVTKKSKMPPRMMEILEAFAPTLKKHRYRNQLSTEIRVKDDKWYFTDATQRAGCPTTNSQLIMWKNFPEIVYHGSRGELVQPIPSGQCSVEVLISAKADKAQWTVLDIPPELREWTSFGNSCEIDGKICCPADDDHSNDVGWIFALGDTPAKAFENLKEKVDLLPDGVSADTTCLIDLIKEAETMESEDIPFSDHPLPPVEDVVS